MDKQEKLREIRDGIERLGDLPMEPEVGVQPIGDIARRMLLLFNEAALGFRKDTRDYIECSTEEVLDIFRDLDPDRFGFSYHIDWSGFSITIKGWTDDPKKWTLKIWTRGMENRSITDDENYIGDWDGSF
jgi:hypothetical protein